MTKGSQNLKVVLNAMDEGDVYSIRKTTCYRSLICCISAVNGVEEYGIIVLLVHIDKEKALMLCKLINS